MEFNINGEYMYKNNFFLAFLMLFSSYVMAEEITDGFKFVSPYYSSIDKQVNNESINAQNLVRKSLTANEFSIPQDWKLISTIAESSSFRLFFQAKNNDVYSFVIDKQGHYLQAQ